MVLGIISDTHGYLPPPVFKHFKDVNTIIHAGDIGNLDIILSLKQIAPLYAISGNIDSGQIMRDYPPTQIIDLNDTRIFVIHNIVSEKFIRYELFRRKIKPQIVIHGHTHIAEIKNTAGILFLNPGSVSKPKQNQAGTIAIVEIDKDTINPKIIEI